jgi:hypothetical protein
MDTHFPSALALAVIVALVVVMTGPTYHNVNTPGRIVNKFHAAMLVAIPMGRSVWRRSGYRSVVRTHNYRRVAMAA